MILTSPRKVQTTNASVLFLCVDLRHINIIHRLYDVTQSPTCPVTENSRLKMACLMATVHHNVPYRTTPPHPQTYRTIRIIFKVIGIIIFKFYNIRGPQSFSLSWSISEKNPKKFTKSRHSCIILSHHYLRYLNPIFPPKSLLLLFITIMTINLIALISVNS